MVVSLLSDNYSFLGDNQSTPRRKRRRKDQPPKKKLQALFTVTDKNINQISKGEWLEDTLINSALALIKEDFPEIEGLQSTLSSHLSQSGFQPAGNGSVHVIQIHHCGGSMQHWVTTCNIDGEMYLYDRLPMKTLSDELQKQIAKTNPRSIWQRFNLHKGNYSCGSEAMQQD